MTMVHFKLFCALLLATTCLLSEADASRTITSCNVQRLSCDSGVIIVQDATYGGSECDQSLAANAVNKSCNGKTWCELNGDVIRAVNSCFKKECLKTTYSCVPARRVVACEQTDAELLCESKAQILVYGADYGRRDKTTCIYKWNEKNINNVYCSNPTDKVAQSCNGKSSCSVTASNGVFGDPCGGTYKYLEVAYACVPVCNVKH